VIGRVVGQRYRIVRLLGRGGMGTVYEAIDLGTSTSVALKMISEELAPNQALRSRFDHERQAATNLTSHHLARLLDAGDDGGRPYLVMEYLRGEDFSQLLARTGPVSEQLALRVVGQACVGIAVAHEAAVVHRDLKPANLFLARGDGESITIKVLDFGVAKLVPDPHAIDGGGALTRTGTVLGSPLYMSPEQARGGRQVDARADIWSLGVVLYRALSAREPHDTVGGLGDLIIAICTRQAPPVQLYAPWVSREVSSILHRALAIEPGLRFQSAGELLAEIRKLVPSLEIRASELIGVTEAERTQRPQANDGPTLCMPASPARPTQSSRPGTGKRVLLIEDNEMNMDMLARRLEKKGFAVLRATDGEAGVALATTEHPDLVLMDIGLPGIDGWEATRRIRASEKSGHTPVLALTAHAMGGEREKAIAAGCDDYEPKPIEFPRLMAKIEALLGR
jgi:serine/threonine protein kinase